MGAVLLWGLLFVRGLWGISRTHRPRPNAERRSAVVAFVPARNEASVIERSVSALLPQVARLVVVDDQSTDGTAEKLAALADPHLEVQDGQGPAEGECGKPAALAFAYERAAPDSEWLLFVDADVVLAPGAVEALLGLAEARDLVSAIPRQDMGSLVERVVMPAVGALILARHPPSRIESADSPAAFANGQIILIRRALYEEIGTHRAVIDQVLEDARLAEKAKAAGGRLLLVDGRHLASTRMYESRQELFEGWIKNLFLLLGADPMRARLWVLLTLFLGWLGPVVALVVGWPIGVAAYLSILMMQMVLRIVGGASPLYAVLAPIGATVTAYLVLASMRRHLSGVGVAWKGRHYRA